MNTILIDRVMNKLQAQQKQKGSSGMDNEKYEAKKAEFTEKLPERGFQNKHELIFTATVELLAKAWCDQYPKGICFCGGTGTGKTTAAKIIAGYLNKLESGYNKFYSAYEICYEFKKLGKNKSAWYQMINKDCHLVIDDLGTEMKVNDFGNTGELMEEVIDIRYRRFIDYGHITVFTTNLTRNEIVSRYTNRIYSRICEMCVLVNAAGSDLRDEVKEVRK